MLIYTYIQYAADLLYMWTSCWWRHGTVSQSFSIPLILSRVAGCWSRSAVTGRAAGCTLDRSPVKSQVIQFMCFILYVYCILPFILLCYILFYIHYSIPIFWTFALFYIVCLKFFLCDFLSLYFLSIVGGRVRFKHLIADFLHVIVVHMTVQILNRGSGRGGQRVLIYRIQSCGGAHETVCINDFKIMGGLRDCPCPGPRIRCYAPGLESGVEELLH